METSSPRVLDLSLSDLLEVSQRLDLSLEADFAHGLEHLALGLFEDGKPLGIACSVLAPPPLPPEIPGKEGGIWCLMLLHIPGENLHAPRTLLNASISRLRDLKASYLWLDVPKEQLGFFLGRHFEIVGEVESGESELSPTQTPVRIGFRFAKSSELLKGA